MSSAGYAKSIIFAADKDQHGVTQHRRFLFTDRERQSTSESLLAQVSLKTTHTLLAEIDDEWDGTDHPYDELVDIRRGPFGAFKVLSAPLEHADSPDVTSFIENFLNKGDDYTVSDQCLDRSGVPDYSSWLSNSEENDIADFLGVQTEILTARATYQQPLDGQRNFTHSSIVPVPGASTSHTAQEHSRTAFSSATASQIPPEVEIMRDGPVLLKYYADTVIPLLTPFKHGKTPWHVLFLPLAKTTLAGITIGEVQDDASLGAFYGILSLSALHLYAACYNQKWSDQACTFKQAAQHHMTSAQKYMYDMPKAFKYKAMVIALLTMAQLAISEGQSERIEHWLLETEKFIRIRGLRKPQKSRKVRLLHHCYAYMRIFHESLLVPCIFSDQRSLVQRVFEESSDVVLGQDDPSFRLTVWDDLSEKLRETKTRELGENDLHLARPGLWTSTLYPEIWGIPESWMVLLSQTIRLSNARDMAEASPDTDTLSLREFSRRSRALEKCILDWNASPYNINDGDAFGSRLPASGVGQVCFGSALGALHHALVIYFYRRVHDLDTTLLQPQVVQVRDNLYACRQSTRLDNRYIAGLIWPAFIAACEATSADLQDSFLEWFDICAQHNRQQYLTNMQKFVRLLWTRRKQPASASLTWLQLLKSKSMVL